MPAKGYALTLYSDSHFLLCSFERAFRSFIRGKMKNKIVKILVGILFLAIVGQVVNAGRRRRWSFSRSPSVSPTCDRPRRSSVIRVRAWDGEEAEASNSEEPEGDLSSSIDDSASTIDGSASTIDGSASSIDSSASGAGSSEDSAASSGKKSLTSEESEFLEAAREGRVVILKRHISNGRIKVNSCTDLLGRTALHHAAQHGNFAVVEYLMAQGANPYLKDLLSKTSLDYALLNRHSGVFWLMENSYDPRLAEFFDADS